MIEGCDSNGCEYMTGGTVVILGKVGDNFAAGMTGGMAFIYDKAKEFEKKVNPESVIWQNVETEYWLNLLKKMVQEHSEEPGSILSKNILPTDQINLIVNDLIQSLTKLLPCVGDDDSITMSTKKPAKKKRRRK